MTEGWFNDEYLVIFSQSEGVSLSSKYKFADSLPGYTLVGLRGWDDFIVINPAGVMCSIPTVPLSETSKTEFAIPNNLSLEDDIRFTGKIKWYLKPIVFGGDPQDKQNLTWVTLEQHVELVVWWNNQYKSIKAAEHV
jgi:hypothetical protein